MNYENRNAFSLEENYNISLGSLIFSLKTAENSP